MPDHVLSGGKALSAKLAEIAAKMGGGSVSVGFMTGATYPDGTSVPAVAYQNEFGSATQPARPFFRRMIAAESPGWAGKLAGAARATDFDGPRALGMVGEDIAGALKQSINDFSSPAIAESTAERKGFDKPLVDTSVMLNSITYEVAE